MSKIIRLFFVVGVVESLNPVITPGPPPPLPPQIPPGHSDTGIIKSPGSRCQEITIPMCKTIRYNYTEMPNSFNHESQDEAGLEVHQYWPLVEIKCSDDLKFFICSLYVPICMDDYAGTVPPCRSVCERARAGCEPVMTQYGFHWPERMACDQFPRFGKHSICMDEKGGEMPGESNLYSGSLVPVAPPSSPRHTPKKTTTAKKPTIVCGESCTCEYPLVSIDKSAFISTGGGGGIFNSNRTVSTGSIQNCVFPCRGYGYQTPEEIRFATYWLTFWSSVTCSLSTLTVLTFLIDSTRFNYPERPIICISFCYVFVSIGYLIRVYVGHEHVACGGENSPVVRYPGILVSPYQTNNPVCTVVFLLTYYFTLSGSCWYVVLTITWYLASVLKWGTEAISEKSGLFHGFVWVSSAILTLVVLLSDSVDGDSVSGICYVGNQDYLNLSVFVLAPFGGLLLVGSLFLVSGFVALVRIRSVIAREVRNFHKLEKLMIKIMTFAFLYSVNAVAVLGVYAWEWVQREKYVDKLNCGRSCERWDGGVSVVGGDSDYKPAYSVLMIKYFMSLATGITSSIWVFSSKTVETWRRFLYSRLLCLCFPSACGSRGGSSSASANSQHTSILTGNGNNLLQCKQTHV